MKLISDGSDLVGVEKVEDIKYMKLLRKSMWIVDAWPKTPNESMLFRYYMMCLKFGCLVPGILYLKRQYGKASTFELGHSYITVFMNAVVAVRAILVYSRKYNNICFHFFHKMHLFNHRNDSDYAYKTHILVHKISHFYTIYTLVMMVCGILLFNLTPLYNNVSKGMFHEDHGNATFEHSVYFAFPFDYTTNLRGYIIFACFNWYICYTCSTYFCVVDLIICLMVFHVWGHMRLLSYNVENIPTPASKNANEDKNGCLSNRYSKAESEEVFNMLRKYIRHHNLIIEFTSSMSDTFSEALLLFYIFHQLSGCLLLLECSQMDTRALVRYGVLTIILFQQLIQLSVIFELLGSSNDRLVDSVYCMPWQYMEVGHRKFVFCMLQQTHRSMNLKALNMVTVGVQTMIAVLKNSFSYFIMLRTVIADEE